MKEGITGLAVIRLETVGLTVRHQTYQMLVGKTGSGLNHTHAAVKVHNRLDAHKGLQSPLVQQLQGLDTLSIAGSMRLHIIPASEGEADGKMTVKGVIQKRTEDGRGGSGILRQDLHVDTLGGSIESSLDGQRGSLGRKRIGRERKEYTILHEVVKPLIHLTLENSQCEIDGLHIAVFLGTVGELRKGILQLGKRQAVDLGGQALAVITVVALERTTTIEIAADGSILTCRTTWGVKALSI